MTKSMSFDDVPIFVYSGSLVVESVLETKTVCYSQRKRPEMTKSMSFDDVPIFMYGHEPFKSSSEPKKTVCYSPQKWPEMTKSTSFDDVPIFVYPGSRAVEIIPGATNCVL